MAEDKHASSRPVVHVDISEDERTRRAHDRERSKEVPPLLMRYVTSERGAMALRIVRPSQRMREGI